MANIYKCILVGNAGVGKTTFVKRHLTGEFIKDYLPTSDVEVNALDFYANEGQIIFNVWDCTGNKSKNGLGQSHYVGADCAIVM